VRRGLAPILSGNGVSGVPPVLMIGRRLNIERVPNNRVVISWLTNLTGFQLESTPSLAPGSWKLVTPPPVVVGSRNVVTNNASGLSLFYRLRK